MGVFPSEVSFTRPRNQVVDSLVFKHLLNSTRAPNFSLCEFFLLVLQLRPAKGVHLTEVRDSVYQRLIEGSSLIWRWPRSVPFEEALEESVQNSSIEGLMADRVREQIQGRVMQVGGVGPVRFVSCAEVSPGKVHIGKTDTGTWCGRRRVHRVTEGLSELATADP